MIPKRMESLTASASNRLVSLITSFTVSPIVSLGSMVTVGLAGSSSNVYEQADIKMAIIMIVVYLIHVIMGIGWAINYPPSHNNTPTLWARVSSIATWPSYLCSRVRNAPGNKLLL